MEEGISRDRWGRPLLPNPLTQAIETYTRASTLSSAIENTYNLEAWKDRQIVSGLVTRPDLILKAQAKSEDRATLDQIIASSLEAAGANSASNSGTAIHALTELVDDDKELPVLDSKIVEILEAYKKTMSALKVVDKERFVACREIMSAGTFDRIVKFEDRYYIADIKTGSDAFKYAHGASVQMGVYSRGETYSSEKGWGVSLKDIVDQNRAILIYLPANGEPHCSLHWVDIATGFQMARMAVSVRKWWKDEICWPLTS